MNTDPPLVHLTTVAGSFHGRIVAARLESEGIRAELHGASDGPYPLPGNVDVFVRSDQLALAREVLLADAVDASFIEMTTESLPRTPRQRRRAWRRFKPRAEN